ncbi:MAG: MBL fold metallo-hydrolase [Clostridia bacterium]|nr:MBL fold metallo-hydrolase [Clostridia bacterium]
MKKNKWQILKRILLVTLILSLICVFCSCEELLNLLLEQVPQDYEIPEGTAQVHFVDIGQGDATLIMADSKTMLIDTGEKDSDNVLINYLNAHNVTKLDYFVISHFDSDHFGEAVEVLNNFEVENVLIPDQVKTTKMYESFMTALDEDESLNVIIANDIVGESFSMGQLNIDVLAPLNDSYKDSNDYSITMLIRWGNIKFLLSGDAEKEAEEDIVAEYSKLQLDCDVFKAGHHGSRTSSSQDLLDKATPDYVVISCGKDNKYEHPHIEAMERFEAIDNVKIYRTDEMGSIVFSTDGVTIEVETEK